MVLTGECDIHLKIPQHFTLFFWRFVQKNNFLWFLIRSVAKESILSAKLIQLWRLISYKY